ncbi:MAG TPA: MATE family efflux transporter [Vulgatibacter sp.]
MSRRHALLSELRQLLKLAAPLAAIHAGNQLMSLVDVAVVGRLGADSLAGVGLANGIFFSMSILGIGVMMGLDPLVSQALGARDPARARRQLWQGVWLALAVTLALALPLAIAPSLLEPFGIEHAAAREARTYLNIRLLSLYPMLLFVGVRAYLQAHGITRPMFLSMIAANVLNAVADVLLVFGGSVLPEWTGPLRALPSFGVAGAAVATTVCTVFQLAFVGSALRLVPAPGFAAGMRRPSLPDLRRALAVGLPIGLQMAAEVSIFALVGFLIGRMGTELLAAHQIALTLASVTFTVAVGIGAATSVRVGRAVGAGDTPGARLAGMSGILGGGAWMSITALIFLLLPRTLAGILTDQAAVIESAVPLLMIAAVFQVSDGLQAVGAGALRGAGDTRYPFVANVLGYYALALPAGLALGSLLGLGAIGLWWGLCIGLTVVAATLVRRFLRISAGTIAPLVTDGDAPRSEAAA